VVVVRDPYRWMQSMCRRRWNVEGFGGKSGKNGCPRLLQGFAPRPVEARSKCGEEERLRTYESLPQMLTEWNRAYLDADFPV
jgi:hypothetical protein